MVHLDGSVVDLILAGRWEPQDEIGISASAYGEAIRGAVINPMGGLVILKASFVRGFPSNRVFPFDRKTAEIFSELSPRRSGTQHARDFMIAATALAQGATLATNDRRLAALKGAEVSGHDPLDIIYIE